MKKRGGKIFHLVLFLILFFTAGFFILPKNVLAEGKSLIINEVMWAGSDEWIEFKNVSDESIDISNWIIISGGKSKKDLTIPKNEKYFIKPNSFFVVPNDLESKDREKVKISLVDSGKRIALKDDKGNEIDETAKNDDMWLAGSKNPILSMERSDDLSFWHSYYKQSDKDEKTGTPKEENSKKPKTKEYSDKIRINEIFPKPISGEKEFIELYNSGEKEDLSGWRLEDRSGKKCNINEEIEKEKFFVLFDCGIKLNDTKGETITLYDPNDKIISSLEYSGSAKKNLSYNFDGKNWKWSKKITPGKENQLNNIPQGKLKINKKIYKNMLAEFGVEASDKDGDNLKFTWNFGDGKKSYKKNASHKYLQKGIYNVSLKISDGTEDVFHNFEIKVGSFPKKELEIVGVKANPKGRDVDNETITIKNNSKKKINLKGWSIATGWKNLYNHQIKKKLILDPGETKEITRKYSAFALNNKQTKIEIRRPDGSVASKVKYSKKEGIKDDEVYEKTESGWEWNAPLNTSDTQTNTEDLQAEDDIPAGDADTVNSPESAE